MALSVISLTLDKNSSRKNIVFYILVTDKFILINQVLLGSFDTKRK